MNESVFTNDSHLNVSQPRNKGYGSQQALSLLPQLRSSTEHNLSQENLLNSYATMLHLIPYPTIN